MYTKKGPNSLDKIKNFYFVLIPNIIIAFGLFLVVVSFGPLLKDELWYLLKERRLQKYEVSLDGGRKDSAFSRFLTSQPVSLTPVNTDFSLVIEKIGVNAPVVKDVSISNEKAYRIALKDGIAHASLSKYPSENPGNVYLFAHASVNFWDLGKYATVFNLLRKLGINDKVHVFYEGKDYVYKVVNREVIKGWNTYPILRPVIEPTLTLQTCDPPGTTLNRLVVTATLVEVK